MLHLLPCGSEYDLRLNAVTQNGWIQSDLTGPHPIFPPQ